VVLGAFVAAAVAAPQDHANHAVRFASSSSSHEFQAPKPGDSRGPCPGLNTLANHGWLNRNGKDITTDQVKAAMTEALGFSSLFANLFTTAAAKKLFNSQTNKLDLADLVRGPPTGIEHPASLSRKDKKKQPDQSKPDESQVAFTLQCAKDGKIGLKEMMECRKRHNTKAEAEDPTLANDANWKTGKTIAFFEGILATRVFAGRGKDEVSVEYLRSFLLKEEFPKDWPKLDNWGVPEFLAASLKAKSTSIWASIREGPHIFDNVFK